MKFRVTSYEELCEAWPTAKHLPTSRYHNVKDKPFVLSGLFIDAAMFGAPVGPGLPRNISFEATVPPKGSIVVPAVLDEGIHPRAFDGIARGGYVDHFDRVEPPEDYAKERSAPLTWFEREARNGTPTGNDRLRMRPRGQ